MLVPVTNRCHMSATCLSCPNSPVWPRVHRLALLSARAGYTEVLTRELNASYRNARTHGHEPFLPITHELQRNASGAFAYNGWRGHAQTASIPFMFTPGVDNGPLIFRREALLSLGGLDEGYSCAGEVGMHYDFEISLRFWAHGFQVGVYYGASSNGVGGRKSLRPEVREQRYRSELANHYKLAALWRAHWRQVQRGIAEGSRELVAIPESEAEERWALVADGEYEPTMCRISSNKLECLVSRM